MTKSSAELEVIRAALLADHLFFARYFFREREGIKFRVNWHHKIICDAIQRVIDGHCKRLIINVPPGSSKTELAVINLIARGLAINPRARFLHLSYSSDLAELNSAKAKELIMSAEYQELFPIPLKSDSKARGRWNVVSEDGISIGGCYATSTLGQVTGFRAGHMADGFQGAIIIDDPLKPNDSLSKTKRDAVNNAYINTVQSRKASPDTPVIVIMQRLADEDLTGFLLDGGDGKEWEHIKIPAIGEDETSYWPEKEPIDSLIQLRENGNFVFAGQYQQEPYVLGGEILRGEWFPRYNELPNWREFSRRAIFADTAMKTGEANDWTVFMDVLMMRSGHLYVLNVWRRKVDAVGLLRLAKEVWTGASINMGREALPPASAMYIEDKASGTGLIQQLQSESIFVPVIPVQRTIDKLTRVMEVQPRIQSGMVYLPEFAPWVAEFVGECEAFTANDTHKHDDQIDPLCDAVNTLAGSGFSLASLV
jgi:predicted phage terminase large subunit-like protein